MKDLTLGAKEASSSRRAFFLKGGAALGAGIATGTGASVVLSRVSPPDPVAEDIATQLASAQEREAIRQLHLDFTRLIETRDFEAAAELFDDSAKLALSGEKANGRSGIKELFAIGYRNQTVATLHDAYRANAQQQQDRIDVSNDLQHASATWHVDVAVGVPLPDDSTAAQMARLQGHLADRRWESGLLEAGYVKNGAKWKMSALKYRG
jgi:ketosteroid isomerase-like protein